MGLLVKQREAITTAEAANLIGVTAVTVWRLYREGKIEGYQLTDADKSPIRVYRDSVVAYVKRVQNRIIK